MEQWFPYYLNYNNFTNTPAINDATLTLATSGIATGSATFTANDADPQTFTVNVPGTNLSSWNCDCNKCSYSFFNWNRYSYITSCNFNLLAGIQPLRITQTLGGTKHFKIMCYIW